MNVQTKVKYIVDDKYSQAHIDKKEKQEEYPEKIYETVDKFIHKLVYDKLNEYLQDKIESIIHLTKLEGNQYVTDLIILNEKVLQDIENTIKQRMPSVYDAIDPIQLHLGILHHVTRFLYDFIAHLYEWANNKIHIKRVRRTFILKNIYNVFFKVYRDIRTFMLQQISFFIEFNRRINQKVTELLYKYSNLDEELIIERCLNDIVGLSLYKINFLKSKNFKAVFKTLARISISYILSRKIVINTVDDTDNEILDSDYFDTKYRMLTNIYELEHLNIYKKYSLTFLITLLKSAYDLGNQQIISNNITHSYLILDTIRENYISYEKILVPNLFRQLITIKELGITESKDILSFIYNDYEELIKFELAPNLKYKYRINYPDLYKILRSITIISKKRNNINKISNKSYDEMRTFLKNELIFTYKYDEKVSEDISALLTSYTIKYMNSVVFIHPISNTPIITNDPYKLLIDISKLYLDFIFNSGR